MKCDKKEQHYLTLVEVSKMLNVHPNTLRNWDKEGILKATRIGIKKIRRYEKSDIDDFIQKTNKKGEN
jgi:excisionase family DNA binding protein